MANVRIIGCAQCLESLTSIYNSPFRRHSTNRHITWEHFKEYRGYAGWSKVIGRQLTDHPVARLLADATQASLSARIAAESHPTAIVN
jgi:hypothetical protein